MNFYCQTISDGSIKADKLKAIRIVVSSSEFSLEKLEIDDLPNRLRLRLLVVSELS